MSLQLGLFHFIAIFFIGAFAPSLSYLLYIWKKDRFEREPLSKVLITFGYGATAYIIYAMILETIILLVLRIFDLNFPWMTALLVAPIVEEALKPLGVWRMRKKMINEVNDGIVYGAASGLGFAATENLLFEFKALITGGFTAWLLTVVLRALSATFLHPAATALTGWGIGKKIVERRFPSWIAMGYIAAVCLHALYNLLAGFSLILAVILGFFAFVSISRRLR